ncbi:PadR family transcriptional regulator, partial [Halorubrum distributum]
MDDGLGNGENTAPRELIHFVTQQTRFALINNILQ